VDGSKGAQLNSASGVILQIIEDDDPGPVMENGTMVNKGVYTESDERPTKAEDWDVTAATGSDLFATFTNITLKGDFYNAFKGSGKAGADRGLQVGGMGAGASGGAERGPGGPPGGPPGGTPGGAMPMGPVPGGPAASGKNMVLSFENTNLTGVITASQAKHAKSSIAAEDYKLLGEVTNTAGPAINNGVIVSLDHGSSWTVTGTSYVTRLTMAGGATLTAPQGQKVTMTVDGKETAVEAGTYKGDIVISVTDA
jgi:hypothetical protein